MSLAPLARMTGHKRNVRAERVTHTAVRPARPVTRRGLPANSELDPTEPSLLPWLGRRSALLLDSKAFPSLTDPALLAQPTGDGVELLRRHVYLPGDLRHRLTRFLLHRVQELRLSLTAW